MKRAPIRLQPLCPINAHPEDMGPANAIMLLVWIGLFVMMLTALLLSVQVVVWSLFLIPLSLLANSLASKCHWTPVLSIFS